ncbi:uncharacterized protein LOC113377900 [Ctenocephalides felis]|uniref:uncharacterized protein LOC113377900 n=1 Tax=Ctenocephalides felis TaxID=7515 RepID=UPI000E6E515F|nr:uncharacterized protein LOC113377900 [Ctenocephalides felis]
MDTKAYEKSRKTDTPLMPALCNACVIGNYELVDKLLVCGADVESKGLGGMTALMLAALYGHQKIFNNLLRYGANLQAKNEAGFTAFDYLDKRCLSTKQTPFYDVTYFQRVRNSRNYIKVDDVKTCDNTEYGLLHRRRKSIPKIKIQQEFNSQWSEKSSVKCGAANFRYSPYMRNEQINHRSKNTPNQILSPNVASFFGNILHMQSSNIARPKSDNEFCMPSMYQNCLPKNSCCPTLSKVLEHYRCEQFIGLFNHHEVNYQVFCSLTESDLIQIGVKNQHYRHQLLDIIQRQKSSACY